MEGSPVPEEGKSQAPKSKVAIGEVIEHEDQALELLGSRAGF